MITPTNGVLTSLWYIAGMCNLLGGLLGGHFDPFSFSTIFGSGMLGFSATLYLAMWKEYLRKRRTRT